jgi:hypothetical protein
VIHAALRLLEGLDAVFIRQVETAKPDPHFGEIERDNVFDDRVVPISRDGQSPLEVLAGFPEVLDLGVKDAEVIEDPRHRLRVRCHLERAEAP